MFKKKGQSTLEYIIILSAIIVAVIVGAALVAKQDKGSGIGKLMDDSTSRITDATARLPGVTAE